MPNLYPGRKPFIGSGRLCVLLFTAFLLPSLVFAQPVITGFSPQSGPVGATVTITGSNFDATPVNDIVYFGSVQATVTAATATSLTVTVPAGASFQPLTVTTAGLTAWSNLPFITTFTDPGQFLPDAFSTRWDIPTGTTPLGIITTDMDGDGKPDLLVAAGDGNVLDIYHNTSTGSTLSFTLAVSYTLPMGYNPQTVKTADLDGDGKPDVVLTNIGAPQLAVFLNTSVMGSISVAAPSYYTIGNYSTGLAIGDCNGDGKPEIVVASATSDLVSVFPNNSTPGSLSFLARKDLPLPSGTYPYSVVVSDFDGDGKPDIASVNVYANSVSVFRNIGTVGGAVSFNLTNIDFSVGSSPQDLAVGDLDGDGKPDLAVVNSGDATISLLQNVSTSGNINFNRGTDVPTGTMNPGSPWALIITDFDGDGKPDIASVNQTDATVSVHKNTSTVGNLSIAANVDYPTGFEPMGLTSADFDGDGMPDLAIFDNTVSDITLLRNKASSEPSITNFTPTAGPAGTVVTITGTNFTGATAVSFGGTAASSFTVVSATSITATVAGGSTGLVSVTTPFGTASRGTFTYGVSPPSITSFSPTSGTPGTTITINGSGFTGATGVSFGGLAASSFTVISDNQITAVVGNGSTGNVSVTTAAGSGSDAGFTYISPAVTISSFSPQSGQQGTEVFIRGHGFLTAQSVSFGGVNASGFVIVGDTAIRATVSTGATGNVTVTGSGSSDSQPGFTFINYTPPPSNLITITAFTPANGSSGDTVYIYGKLLTTTNSVTFGGTRALYYQALNDSVMFAVVGAGSTGAVRVANSTNADSLSLFTFTYDTTKTAPAIFQLIQFSGAINGDNRILQWQVRNDGGIANYVVERSSDSILFSVIGTVKSTRTNGSSHTYSYTDTDPGAGTNWYRLKMQDTTASYVYSSKVKLQPTVQRVYPNPVKYGFFYFELPDFAGVSQIRLFDTYGKLWQVTQIPAGNPVIRVNVPGLPAGAYRLNWTNGTQTASFNILILYR